MWEKYEWTEDMSIDEFPEVEVVVINMGLFVVCTSFLGQSKVLEWHLFYLVIMEPMEFLFNGRFGGFYIMMDCMGRNYVDQILWTIMMVVDDKEEV